MSGRVLLVEDEVDARESLARSFARAGYVCSAAGSAPEALACLAALGSVDVCVLDVRLGADESAGIDLIPAVRRASHEAPIIVVTAFADLDKVKRALNLGAAYLLEKPFTAAELLDVMARVRSDRKDVTHLVERALAAASLTDKEAAIARLLLKGLPTPEIARLEGNSDRTIRQHVSSIYAKCGVSSRAELFHHVFEH
jgi:DNA-binding NarL/FixJ family response regulator